VRANWLDTLLHAHFNRTLWRHVAAEVRVRVRVRVRVSVRVS